MRRSVSSLVVALAATVAVAPLLPAVAVGPGGWDHVGVGASPSSASLNGTVSALNTDKPGVLYAGGNFTSAGGDTTARRIAAWDGSGWSALGDTPLTNGAVTAIAYHAGNVYVGGTFENAGGEGLADYLAVWDGSTWAPFCSSLVGPAFDDEVNALQIIGNTLYVGGAFHDAGGIDTADYLVACDLTTGQSRATVLPGDEFSGLVLALTADSQGTLYAGGRFNNLSDNLDADNVASYDGSTWEPMGGAAIDSFVRGLAAHGTDVYVGTDSVNIAGIGDADHVARWDGTAWNAVGSNTAGDNGWFPATSFIYDLAMVGSVVVATGQFQDANATAAADNIAYFDGAKWRPIGSDGAGNGPFSGTGTALGITGGKVYVGGSFTSAGGDTLARFLGSYALRLPDAAVGATPTGHFVGNNVYSKTGVGQVRNVKVTRGRSVTSYVKIENDGIQAASFTLHGTGGARGITTQYFRGASNVTNAVRNGTYTTGSIAPRGEILLRVVVSASNSSAANATITTTARSQPGTPPDAVRVVVKAMG